MSSLNNAVINFCVKKMREICWIKLPKQAALELLEITKLKTPIFQLHFIPWVYSKFEFGILKYPIQIEIDTIFKMNFIVLVFATDGGWQVFKTKPWLWYVQLNKAVIFLKHFCKVLVQKVIYSELASQRVSQIGYIRNS